MKARNRKNYILAFSAAALSISAVAFALPVGRLNASAENHSHVVCGYASCSHTEHTEIVYSPMNADVISALQTQTKDSTGETCYLLPEGNYVFTENVTLDKTVLSSGSVSLCLNGNTITFGDRLRWEISSGSLRISDCQGEATGSVQLHDNAYGILVNEGTVFDLWDGTVKSTLSTAVHVSDGGKFRQYGGNLVHAPFVMTDCAVKVCAGADYRLYDGSVTGAAHAIVADTDGSSVHVYGGSVTYKHGYGIYVKPTQQHSAERASIKLYGGSFQESTGESSYERGGLYLHGAVDATLEGVTVRGSAVGVSVDGAANVLLDPEREEDIDVRVDGVAILSAATPLGTQGKLTVKGGNYHSNTTHAISIEGGSVEILGGSFDNSASNNVRATFTAKEGTTALIKGGKFTADLVYRRAIEGTFRIVGAPSINGRVIVFAITSADGYNADLLGYTGKEKLSVWYSATTPALSHHLVIAKGRADKIQLVNEGWAVVDGTDGESRPVVMAIHVAHEGGEATCTTPAQCTVCLQNYTLPHTYGDLRADGEGHWRECAVCGEPSQKEAHRFENGTCECGFAAPVPVGLIIGISCTVVAVGGFAVYWFVIKRRTVRDLLSIFKK